MKQVTIEVTQEDIDKGCTNAQWRSFNCPVARAVDRVLAGGFCAQAGLCDMVIGASTAANTYDFSGFRIEHQACVEEFIWRFDKNMPVVPFSFTIDVPDELLPTPLTEADTDRMMSKVYPTWVCGPVVFAMEAVR